MNLLNLINPWILLLIGESLLVVHDTNRGDIMHLQAGQGLAWQFEGDKGIENHPSIIFSDNFESGELDDLKNKWGYVSNRDGKVLSFSGDVPAGSSGERSLKMTASRGKNEGGELYKVFDSGWDKVYLRFYTKFAADHGSYHHFVALRGFADPLPYPTGGAGQMAENHFSVTIEPSFNPKVKPQTPLGVWKFYTYWPEMRSWQTPEGKPDGNKPNPYYGNSFQPSEPNVVPRGEWIAVEIMVKLNSSSEKRDGEMALWINGKPMVHFAPGIPKGYYQADRFHNDPDHPNAAPFDGFQWRHDMDVKVNILRLQHYVSDEAFKRSQAYAEDNPDYLINTEKATVWFDHVVMAKEYIGLMRY